MVVSVLSTHTTAYKLGITMTLGQRLRQRRSQIARERGLDKSYTQEEIATVAGVSQPTYCYAEDDERRMAPFRYQRIAEFYGMPMSDCFPEHRLTKREREQLQGAVAVFAEGPE
jgi:transcriptional regulator with XRE-family HTH domain